MARRVAISFCSCPRKALDTVTVEDIWDTRAPPDIPFRPLRPSWRGNGVVIRGTKISGAVNNNGT